jgi:hypothetical protein
MADTQEAPDRSWMRDPGCVADLDEIARAAMAALLACTIEAQLIRQVANARGVTFSALLAQRAYDLAEAMIVEKYARRSREAK